MSSVDPRARRSVRVSRHAACGFPVPAAHHSSLALGAGGLFGSHLWRFLAACGGVHKWGAVSVVWRPLPHGQHRLVHTWVIKCCYHPMLHAGCTLQRGYCVQSSLFGRTSGRSSCGTPVRQPACFAPSGRQSISLLASTWRPCAGDSDFAARLERDQSPDTPLCGRTPNI
jgi:hypothetical protein